jgi:hypothetical protein
MKIDKFLDAVINACGEVSDAAYRAKRVHVWHSADGRVTPITEMDDTWLRNAIGCVERGKAKGTKYTRVLPFMRAELMRREAERHPMRFVRVPPTGDVFGPNRAEVRADSAHERLNAHAEKLVELDSKVKQLSRNQTHELAPSDDALGRRIDKQAESLRKAHDRLAALEDGGAGAYSAREAHRRITDLRATMITREQFTRAFEYLESTLPHYWRDVRNVFGNFRRGLGL